LEGGDDDMETLAHLQGGASAINFLLHEALPETNK
jgi:hypothetical protein